MLNNLDESIVSFSDQKQDSAPQERENKISKLFEDFLTQNNI